MRKVLRGYATDENGNLTLIGTIPIPNSKDKCPRSLAGKRDVWSGRAQRFLKKKRFASHPHSERRGRCLNSVGRIQMAYTPLPP
jgi:hypothetical protein